MKPTTEGIFNAIPEKIRKRYSITLNGNWLHINNPMFVSILNPNLVECDEYFCHIYSEHGIVTLYVTHTEISISIS